MEKRLKEGYFYRFFPKMYQGVFVYLGDNKIKYLWNNREEILTNTFDSNSVIELKVFPSFPELKEFEFSEYKISPVSYTYFVDRDKRILEAIKLLGCKIIPKTEDGLNAFDSLFQEIVKVCTKEKGLSPERKEYFDNKISPSIYTINELFEQLEKRGIKKFSSEEKEKIALKWIINEEKRYNSYWYIDYRISEEEAFRVFSQ